MSSETVMRRVLDAVLPKGSAWVPVLGGGYDGLLDGIADNLDQVQAFLANLAQVRSPESTTALEDLEREFGVLTDTGLTDDDRRNYLAAVAFPEVSTGSKDNLEDRLQAAGFNVYVWPNDPAIDPSLLLFNEYATWCGETEAVCGNAAAFCGLEGGDLLVNGAQYEQFPDYEAVCGHSTTVCFNSVAVCGYFEGLRREEITYQIPDSQRWNYIFFVGGSMSRWESFIDWNMEYSHTDAWTAGNNSLLTKSGLYHQSGIRSLRIDSNGANTALQQNWPIQLDPDLLAFYRTRLITQVWGPSTYKKLENLAYWNMLRDGNMEKSGTDVIADGDMEVTGPDVVVDGDMEAAGTGSWTPGNFATLSKQTGSPYEGTQNLRVARNGVNNPSADQAILTIGKTYRVTGAVRSDGNAVPKIYLGSALAAWTGTTSTSWQTFDFVDVATSATFSCVGFTSTGTEYAEFDAITVTDETVACAAWTIGNNALLSKYGDAYEGSQVLRVEYDGTNSPYAAQTILTVGNRYRITGSSRGDGSFAPQIWMTGGGGLLWTGTTSTSWQSFDVTFVAVGTILRFFSLATGTGYAEFDDVRVIDVDSAVDEWNAGNNAELSKTLTSPEAGDRCLRVAYNGTNNPYATAAGAGGCALVLEKSVSYRVIGRARSDGSITPQIYDLSTGVIWTGTTSTDWQSFDVTFTPTATSDISCYVPASGSGYCEFDSMLLFELFGGDPIYGNAATVEGAGIRDAITPWFRGLDWDGLGSYAACYFDEIVNGTFDADTDWTKGTGWTIGSGVASKASGTASLLSQANTDIRNGKRYRVKFTVSNYVAGTVTPLVGGVLGTARSANGTYTEVITAGGSQQFDLSANAAADYDIDDLLVQKIDDWFEYENITIAGFFKFDDVTTEQGLVTNSGPAAERQSLTVKSGNVEWSYYSGSLRTVQAPVSIDTWYHVAAVRSYDGSKTTISLYIDGVLIDSDTQYVAPVVTTPDMYFGILDIAGGSGFFNGIATDHIEIFNAAKDADWVEDEYDRHWATLLEGPYAGQELDPSISGLRPLSAATWNVAVSGVASYSLLMIKNDSDVWEMAYFNGSFTPGAKNPIEYDLLDGIKEARMFTKFAQYGLTYWDDLKVFDPIIERAQIKYAQKEKFERIILQLKPMHSWAGLLIDYV